MSTQKVWFVTGASQGLGLELVQQLLKAGYAVAATSRKQKELSEAVNDTTGAFLPLAMDLQSEASVKAAIDATVARFGRIDVVVNNAGYGQIGAVEELTDAEVRGNFEINVFGLLHVVRNVMPILRAQASGHIFNVASIGGFTGAFAGWGVYCATKFSVVGLSESLAAEVAPFGVKVIAVLPGYFRTNFLTAGSMGKPSMPIAEYAGVRASQDAHENQINGNQPGDPVKAALVMIEVAEVPQAPVHLFLGQDAYDAAAAKIKTVESDLASVRTLATATGF